MALKHEFLNVSAEHLSPLVELNNLLFPKNAIRCKNGEKVYWPPEYEGADDILLNIITDRCSECVNLDDDIVRSMLHDFEIVDTLYGGFIPFSGINYYGFTLIPLESIPTFISVLADVKTNLEIDTVLNLCDMAIDKKQYILHRGV